jgi:multidrug efflux pump subunit AcrA (membrane-fusion protein)
VKKIIGVVVLSLAVLLTACSTVPSAAAPTPAGVPASLPAVVSASGKVTPARWATVSLPTGGTLTSVKVQAGDQARVKDVLMQLDDADAKLQVAQAEAALAVAKAQLAQTKAPPQAERIAVAEQAVKQAEAALQGTQAQLDQLRVGTTKADLAAAEASVAQAEAQLKVSRDNYDNATKCYKFKLPDGSKEGVCPGLGTIEEQARAALNSADHGYQAAVARVDQLKAGATRDQIAAAQANVAAAKAQHESEQAQLDLLKAGAPAEQIKVAEAAVQQAQVTVDTAKTQLAKLHLAAPFDGTIGTVYVRQGEAVTPGQPLITIGDLGQLQIETTDLSETDVARVREGQPVQITFDALPGKTLTGTVKRIAPMSTPGQGGVNYTVTIALGEGDPALRWGMTAFVDIQVNQ